MKRASASTKLRLSMSVRFLCPGPHREVMRTHAPREKSISEPKAALERYYNVVIIGAAVALCTVLAVVAHGRAHGRGLAPGPPADGGRGHARIHDHSVTSARGIK